MTEHAKLNGSSVSWTDRVFNFLRPCKKAIEAADKQNKALESLKNDLMELDTTIRGYKPKGGANEKVRI